jgi:chitodextrinase
MSQASTPAASAVYAPYIDLSIYTPQSLVAIAQAAGTKAFTLGFIQSAGANAIAWAGTGSSSITSDVLPNGTTVLSQVQALQAAGDGVIISFGGGGSTDPAMTASNAAALQAEYQSVINRYNVSALDFYIAGTPETDAPSIALRNRALAGLKAANPKLTVSFTLPATPTGLDAKGLNIVTSAVAAGVTPDVVNLLTSDYNSQVDQGGAMGLDAIDAALGTEKQLKSLGITSKIGITPMIGLNDVTPEVFTLADAQAVANFAKSDPNIARLSMWSVARDNGNSAGATQPTFNSSGIAQTPYEFSNIFEAAAAAPPPVVPSVPTGLSAAVTSDTSVTLQWNASTVTNGGTVTGYAVFENGTQIATTTSTRYGVTGLTPQTAYNFTVDAIDAVGSSAQTAPLAVTTKANVAAFAPYIDMSIAVDDNMVAIAQASGITTFTLAFIQSSGENAIAWAGTGSSSIANDVLPDTWAPNITTALSQVQALQAAGDGVIISFGGAGGTDPAMASSSAQVLQAEYQSVIDRYHVTSLDFDIEGKPETDASSIALRNQALAGLKAANPGLAISFTLPTTPSGLDAKGLNVVSSAVAAGVTPDIINLMTGDYNSQVDQGGAMGLDAIDAALGTEKQLQSLGITSKIGITPMIGVNDVIPETFTLADAQQVAAFAASDPNIARLSMWSVARDNGSGAGATYPSNTSSGLSQAPYAFSKIFETI